MKKINLSQSEKVISAFPAMAKSMLCFSLIILAGCEAAVAYKPGGQALRRGDEIMMVQGNVVEAKSAYNEALASSSLVVKGDAAYTLATLAKAEGNIPAYNNYLTQAAAAGNVTAQIELAEIRLTTEGPAALEKMGAISMSLLDVSSNANLTMLKAAQIKNDQAAASQYARNAEKILIDQIYTKGDPTGGKALMLARLYADYPQYFTPPRDAEKFYRDAIAKGNVKAAQELAMLWLRTRERKNPEADVFVLMKQAADAGNPAAIKYVANAYQNGTGVARNETEALAWFEKVPGGMADGAKLRVAQSSMKSDKKKALALFREAAAGGSLPAMLMVDSMSGENPLYAKQYAQNAQALFSIVRKNDKLYGQGNADMISKQYRLAADAGSGKAALRIANDLEANDASDAEIAKWYEKAAKSGEPKAMMMLARQAKIGQSMKRSDEDAFGWYKKAAEAGDPEAQYETGLAYARGQGTKKDLDKARTWLKKAQAGGYVLALDVLKTIDKE